MMSETKEVKALKSKLNVISGVLRLGHEAFRRKGTSAIGWHIVNNSRLVVRFDRSALLDMRSGKPRIVALMGEAEANSNTEYGLALQKLCTGFGDIEERTLITAEFLQERGASEDILKAFAYLSETSAGIVAVPMREPESSPAAGRVFIWMVEFAGELPGGVESVIQLLAESYGEALWSSVNYKKKLFGKLFNTDRLFSPLKIMGGLLALFILALIFKNVSQNVAADFEIVPLDKQICYAPYDGVIDSVSVRNGVMVRKNQELMKYRTEELEFRLSDAQKSHDEISARIDLVRSEAFSDNSKLGEIKLLLLRKEKEQINIEKMKWYLERSRIFSGRSGVFVIEDEERWDGKAVRAGDELCQIYSPDQMIAKVLVNERDASVIDPDKMNISLYLHTRPESPLQMSELIFVSPKPVLQKNGQFCYELKVKLSRKDLIFGMRGVARVSGPEVKLGYYLFRNLVLWWRRL